MKPEHLARVRQEVEHLLTVAAEGRERRLAELAADDAGLAQSVAVALTNAERDDPAFEPLVTAPPWTDVDVEFIAGARLGPWRLERPLGRGGMGAVWLAERADGSYRQQVAIKVPLGTAQTAVTFARFERERSLLAEFDHAGIARLVDGGWTPHGRPWLAMEYVDGQRLDDYASQRQLDRRERVQLLRAASVVLAAAHQRRIVHRDLKPQNLLVRTDGRVVLVDFGIAAVLDDPGSSSGRHLATVRYAAPEQLRGEVVTTAADVHALGVIGRELIPAGDLDLDAILAVAADPDPQRRPANASVLAAELDRWLAFRPVEARRASGLHRLRLFARRDPRSAFALGTLATAAAGLSITAILLWRSEHAAHRLAASAQLAEAREHAQVRQLVRDLMAGVHDRIETLPGAVPVRAFLAERAEGHLAQYRDRAATDPELAHEMIEVQLRLAAVRGGRGPGNLGDGPGAIRAVNAALELAQAWAGRHPGEDRWHVQVARTLRTSGDLHRSGGDLAIARDRYRSAWDVLARVGTRDYAAERLAAILDLQLGKLDVAEGAFASGRDHLAAAARAFDRLHEQRPSDRDLAHDAAMAHAELGYAASSFGDHAVTTSAWQAAQDRLAALIAVQPQDNQLRRDQLELALELSLDHVQAGRTSKGNSLFDTTLAQVRELLAADRGNLLAERLLHRALVRGARLASAQGDHRQAVRHYREVEPLLRTRLAAQPGERELILDLAESLIARAEAERLLGTTAGVAEACHEALALVPHEQALARSDHFAGNLLTMAWVGLGNLALANGDAVGATTELEARRPAATAWAERFPDLHWPLRHLGAFEYALGTAWEKLAADGARPPAERLASLDRAGAAFARGLAVAERLAASGRLHGAEKAMPRLFAADVQRVQQSRASMANAAGR
ncbi:MAG: serine/threonine protein kinase [Planctomycetes bacterium]|nr:serine/threonine protein kinase [Planctomycetota bacterium]